MRTFFKRLYVAMAAFVGLVITAAFVALGVVSAQTTSGKIAWSAFGVFTVLHMAVSLYFETTGRRLVAWWPVIHAWTNSLVLKLAMVLPLFLCICYLLLYASLVQITGTRPEWLEP